MASSRIQSHDKNQMTHWLTYNTEQVFELSPIWLQHLLTIYEESQRNLWSTGRGFHKELEDDSPFVYERQQFSLDGQSVSLMTFF